MYAFGGFPLVANRAGVSFDECPARAVTACHTPNAFASGRVCPLRDSLERIRLIPSFAIYLNF